MGKKITKLLSSWFFVGYIPVAPATFGTLGSLPLIFLLKNVSVTFKIIFLLFSSLFAIIISSFAEKYFNQKDSRRIVIDEVAGFLILILFLKESFFTYLLLAFILFRFFDIVKLYPANKMQNLPGGWGVVCDDLVAGLQTGIVIQMIYIINYMV